MNLFLVGFIVAAVFYVICYLALDNFIIAVLPAALSLVYFGFFAEPQINKYKKKIETFEKCYQFINNYLVALSIQPALDVAYEHSMSTLDSSFIEKVGDINQFNAGEKLRYLSNYFPFHCYKLFVDLVDMWQEQGGDILKMSNYLTNQMAQINEYISTCKQMSSKKVVEFVILWIFSLAILVVLRFALSQFYSMLVTKSIYQMGIVAIFGLCILSVQLLISKITKIEIRGWEKNGK